MTRQTSDLLKAAGTGFEILKGITDEVLALGGDDEDLRRINKDAALRRKIAELILTDRTFASYEVVVNYDLSFAGMIRAAGCEGHVNPSITAKHFPIKDNGEGKVVVELVHFNSVMTDIEVTLELNRRGFRDATLAELLALSTTCQDFQRQFPIVARGSVWQNPDGYHDVPYLRALSDKWRLDLSWLENKWGAHCRFAAVRKPSAARQYLQHTRQGCEP